MLALQNVCGLSQSTVMGALAEPTVHTLKRVGVDRSSYQNAKGSRVPFFTVVARCRLRFSPNRETQRGGRRRSWRCRAHSATYTIYRTMGAFIGMFAASHPCLHYTALTKAALSSLLSGDRSTRSH